MGDHDRSPHPVRSREHLRSRPLWAPPATLRTTIVPAARFDVGDDFELPLSKTPIMCSFTRVGGRYVLDASEKEELAGDERIHITLGDDGHVHSLQKGLKGRFTAAEFAEIMAQAQDHTKVLRSKVLRKQRDPDGEANEQGWNHGQIWRPIRCERSTARRSGTPQEACLLHVPILSIPEGQTAIRWHLVLQEMWPHVRRWCLGAVHSCLGCQWILRRSIEGATSADMAFIAQEKAMEYERRRAAGELDEEE